MEIVIVSGYFDCLHKGHLELLRLAKPYGEELWVIVNNDEQAKLKKGKSFMNEDERIKIMTNIKGVDKVFISIDKDRSVCETLRFFVKSFPENNFIFANGGDVTNEKCREFDICEKLGIIMIDTLGDKIQSSSLITGIKENGNG